MPRAIEREKTPPKALVEWPNRKSTLGRKRKFAGQREILLDNLMNIVPGELASPETQFSSLERLAPKYLHPLPCPAASAAGQGSG